MKNQENKNGQILVEFSISRGGRYYNPGYLTYCGYENTAKHHVEQHNFLAYENEDEIINEQEEEVENIEDMITDLNYELGDNYNEFCNKYGDLGGLVIKNYTGHEIGDYVEDGLPFFYDEDGQYNSTYGKFLNDCTEQELEIIAKSGDYKPGEIVSFLVDFNPEWKFDQFGCLEIENIEE